MFHLLRLNSGEASSRCFVYLFPNYMYEISEFMRSQVKWKVTVERSSEKLKFAKPKKWQDSAKWKVKSQVTDSVWMKASGLFAKRLSIVKCLYSCRQSQSFLTLEFTISNHVPLVIIQDMLLIYREKHNYIK